MDFTFGIITATDDATKLLPIIESIWKECIVDLYNNFEIIVVGGTPDIELTFSNFFVKWLPFDESTKKNWITRKKNIITEQARFENVVYLHDYVALEPGWYDGFRAFGDDWNTCMTKVLNSDGTRYRDWCVIDHSGWYDGLPDDKYPFNGPRLLKYKNSCPRWQYYSGAYWVAKREVMRCVPLDESRVWAEGEDVKFSRQLYHKYGESAFKMNTRSTVKFLKYKEPVPWQYLEPI